MIILPVLIVFGLIGNTLICIAVVKFKRLHKVPNYFIVSLAIADLIVCGGIMPFGIYQQANGGYWLLGVLSCRIFTSFDVVTATASIWNLCLIAVDRFLAVTKPVWYSTKRTGHSACLGISAAWLLSAMLAAIPAILIDGLHTESSGYACVPEKDTAFLLMSSTFVFWIPCTITISFYWKVLTVVTAMKKRVAPRVVASGTESRDAPATTMSVVSGTAPSTSRNVLPDDPNRLGVPRSNLQMEKEAASGISDIHRNTNRDTISVAGEKKTLKVLMVVLGCFIFSWLPFFLFLTTQGLCSSCAMTPSAFHIVRWLGWCNSLVNPVLYSIFNRDFRSAFQRLLCCSK